MSKPTAREIGELRRKMINAANEGFFQFCADFLGGTTEITEDNLQAAWDIIRDEDNANLDSLDRIEFVMAVEDEFNCDIEEQSLLDAMRSDEYQDVNTILVWIDSRANHW